MEIGIGIKLLIVIICAWLWRKGGSGAKYMRRVILPIILGLYYALTYVWWALLLVGGAYAIGTSLGYGEDTWFWKVFKKGWVVRGVVGLLVALIGAVSVYFITSHSIYLVLIYILLNAGIGCTLSYYLVKDIIIEPVIGACVASIILFMG